MSIINLPSRGLKNKLIPIEDAETGYYYLETELKIDGSIYRIIFDEDHKTIVAIDPDSGPFMGIGYKITDPETKQKLELDSIESNGVLHFKSIE